MTKKEKKLIGISLTVAVFLVTVSYFYQLGLTGSDSKASVSDVSTSTADEVKELTVGEPGSTHAHVSFVMLIEGNFYNFSRDKYYEQSKLAHFHEGNGVIIHKHAKGVSIPYFLNTLGIELTDNCVILDEGDDYCEDGDKKWRMVVNGDITEDPEKYEIRHGDRILLDYSSDSDTDLRVKAQATLPDVPKELMEDYSNILNN